ncbi:TetR/AcrR family transcriptional regulator [Halobacillus massiliensis]|uniref:TetR/AcrR family transcriptional regulator n=1 Tax=Halobacillus massiliensis TaxID=1926286 RepID=UPI0009E2A5E1|nr:TetR/AcrR family transcriptional regulator [Halobacillus massiliensis]
MEDKKVLIIETSIKLFASKGFTATSVQEIASECNISKGAFYLYFKSKDALLLEIFYHYSKEIQLKTEEIQSLKLDPRTKLIKQLSVTFNEIIKHRDFIIMQIREQAIPFNKDIETFMQKMRFDTYFFYKNGLLAIYGREIEHIIWEITVLLQGIFKAYVDLIIVEGVRFDIDQLCQSIVKRMDFLVKGFSQSGVQPIITNELMNGVIPQGFHNNQIDSIIHTLETIEKENSTENIRVTSSVLLEEIKSDKPRTAVIKGMLSNLENEEDFKGIAGQIRTSFLI